MSENQLDKLIPALIKFQSAVKPPAKTKTNPHLQNKYADLADIIDVIREPLSQNGFAFTQMVNGGTLITILMHESGQSLTAETSLMLDKQTMQGMGSAITYARRYALSAILGIAADDDDDGNGASSTQKTQSQVNIPANREKTATGKSDAKNNPCTELQQTQINSLWQDLGKSEAQLKAQLRKDMGVDSVEELTGGQAAIVVAGILGLLKAKKEKANEQKA